MIRNRRSARRVKTRLTAAQARIALLERTLAAMSAAAMPPDADQASERKSQFVATFVATVSHEIRTPLNAVVNSLALLDQAELAPPQQRLASVARQAGDALLDLVNDILDMSQVEAGRLTLRPVVFDIRQLVAGVADMFRAQAAARGVRLALDVAPEVPLHLRADSARLRQVMMNFVSNAAKFALPGVVAIRVATTVASGAPALRFAVGDPGPRIPERDAQLLFQPFARLRQARDTGTPGTGLGLAICERLARLMAGQIGLGASPEGGNEFWLTLPLEAAVPAAVAEDGPPRRRRRASVLLVEDVPSNRLVTTTILRRQGHRVDIAGSGAEAVQMAQAAPYDLVLMDLVMPGMSGYEAARAIRALPPPARDMPIVALTATTAAEDRARCAEAGMNDLLGKPVSSADLLAATNRTAWPAAAPGDPPVDLPRLAELRQSLSPAALAGLVAQCLDEFGQRLPALREALASGHKQPVERHAHTLAGMAATYGLLALERRMRRVLTAAQRGHIADAAVAARDLEAELRRAADAVLAALRAIAA